jgi:hypothetical protein
VAAPRQVWKVVLLVAYQQKKKKKEQRPGSIRHADSRDFFSPSGGQVNVHYYI